MRIAIIGVVVSILFGIILLIARVAGYIEVPGYTATALLITFFGALNCLGFGIVGNYAWRAYENTKNRPNYIVASKHEYNEG